MKIFTNEDICRINTATIKNDGVSQIDLMERGASAIAYEIFSRWRQSKRIVIFAGPGNNGGDALAVARLIIEQGYSPEIYLFNIKSSNLSECCSINRNRLLELEGVNFTEVVNTFQPPALGANDVVIDGLFGTGLRPPLKGGYTSLVQYINESKAYVVSIDVPSGLAGEWNDVYSDRRNIIKANLTLVLQYRRLSFFFAENAEYIGEYKELDVNLNTAAANESPTDYYLIEQNDVRKELLRNKRSDFSNKYDNGTIYLVSGSYGMMGASILATRGAMRSGAGLVTVHAPRCGYNPMQTAMPEILFEGDKNEFFTTKIELRHKYGAIALGPGMGTNELTINALDSFLKTCRQPVILDADALNCIAARPILLRSIPARSIITPHAIEFDRLFGPHHSDEERLKKAIEVAQLYTLTIVLKGHYTMTIRHDGKVYINSSGNSGMATAGSGDVLTGVIASMVAQGYALDLGVALAVYIHGKAGDLVAQEHGICGVMASDIANNVGKAIKLLMETK